MNISDMSPEFIDMLSEEQKAQLLKDIAAKAKEAPEPAPAQQPVQASTGYQDQFAMPAAKARVSNQPVQWQGNTFEDTGSEHHDSENETPKVTLTPRTRKAPEVRQLRCAKCGRDFNKRSDQIFGTYHVCHRCGGRG